LVVAKPVGLAVPAEAVPPPAPVVAAASESQTSQTVALGLLGAVLSTHQLHRHQ